MARGSGKNLVTWAGDYNQFINVSGGEPSSDGDKLPWDCSLHFMLTSLSQPNAILCSCKLLFNCKILAGVESSSTVNPIQLKAFTKDRKS
jgi:hypothetical protein